MTDQQQIARWLNWTPHGDDYWLIPDELDMSPEPGLQSGEPRHLPDLETFAGRAEWVALIKDKLMLDYYIEMHWFLDRDEWRLGVTMSELESAIVVYEATELAALTAAVLALMEDES